MKNKERRRPSFVIQGVRFRSGGDGHWYSEGGRYMMMHGMRGTTWEAWELYTLNKKGDPDEYIDGEVTIRWVISNGNEGKYTLEKEE